MTYQKPEVFTQILPNDTVITLKFSENEIYQLEPANYTTIEDYAGDKVYQFSLPSIPKNLLNKVINKQNDSKLRINEWLKINGVLNTSLTLSMFDALTLEKENCEVNSTAQPEILVNMPEQGNILEVSILIPVDSFKTITFK